MAVRLLHYSDIETAYDQPERIGRLAGLINQRATPGSIILGTGDNTAPGVLSLATDGRQALDFYTEIQPDLATFGNHDFDHGLDSIRRIVRDSPQTWVNTNIFHNGQRFANSVGAVPTASRTIDDVTLGFFGVLDPATPNITPQASSLEVTDPIAAARTAIGELREAGADQFIALSHLGAGDRRLAEETAVDVVLGGHTHTKRVDEIAGTICTRPGANAELVLELEYDSAWTVTRHSVDAAPIDAAVADALRTRVESTAIDEAITHTAQTYARTRDAVFAGDTQLGTVVAAAYRRATDADIGLQNSGGLRPGPALAGTITKGDLIGVVPFAEPVGVAELTGDELVDVLTGIDGRAVDFGAPDWQLGYVSGAALTWNEGALTDISVQGTPLRRDATYTLATSAYLFWSDREFPALTPDHQVAVTDRHQYEIFVDYVREHGLT